VKPARPACALALLGAVLLGLHGAAWAQDGGLASEPACRLALEQLKAREAAAATERNAARGRLDAARRRAATACLGGPDRPASAPARAGQSPAAVPRAVAPAPLPLPRADALPAAPPRPSSTPLTVTACDATGCWTSEGTRLLRAGPNLLGPTGVCTTSGPFVQCPP
jgi:hypothetical protein